MSIAKADVTEREQASIPSNLTEAENPPAWVEIEEGRYMPRRIRGSFRGRELG